MCKPCQAELAKYKSGGALKRKKGSSVNLYQDTGLLEESGVLAPTKTSERTITTDKFNTSNVLSALGDFGTNRGTWEAYRNKSAGLDASLIAEQNRVASVRKNILPNAEEMTRVANYIDNPTPDQENLATEQYQEIMDMTYNNNDLTLGEQNKRMLEMNKNMHPDVRKLFPNEGRSKNNNIFTFASIDKSPVDGPPNTVKGSYSMNDSLMCIGSVCGAFQEAGANVPTYTGNKSFRKSSLAGKSGFSSIPLDEAEPGDVIQQAGRARVDYRDSSKGYEYRPHHAGIINEIADDGIISAYNSKDGNLGRFGLSGDFLQGEDGMAYRYTGNVPKVERSISNFQGDSEALNFLKRNNSEIPYITPSPATTIDHNFPKELVNPSRNQTPTNQTPTYTEPSNFWKRKSKTKNNNVK